MKTYNPFAIPQDSPTEKLRKQLPQGNCDWAEYDKTQARLSKACQLMAKERYVYLSDLHIKTMAVLGCGHEETMKAHVLLIVDAYGYDLYSD